MSNSQITFYIVEGETERKLINTYKNTHIRSGKVSIFNLWDQKINNIERRFGIGSTIICILDTDQRRGIANLLKNIQILKDQRFKVIVFLQNKNLEDEIIRSCSAVKNMTEIFNCPNNKVKKCFCEESNLKGKLEKAGFDITKMWQEINTEKDIKHNSFKTIQIK